MPPSCQLFIWLVDIGHHHGFTVAYRPESTHLVWSWSVAPCQWMTAL